MLFRPPHRPVPASVNCVCDVAAEKIPPDLRLPNSTFVAVVLHRDLVRVEPFGDGLLEIENRIRVVLNVEWDTIGVAGIVDDEYDGDIAGILGLLERNATTETIAQHLKSIEVEWIGLRASPHHKLPAMAEALGKLHLPRSPG